MSKRKIMIIAPLAFGYTSYIHKALSKFDSVEASIVFIENNNFKYKTIFHRLYNAISKLFFNVNQKKRYILSRLKSYDFQDEILIIRPDMLEDYVLIRIKAKTKKFTAFYFDSIGHFPRKKSIIHFFDRILSFDKEDIKNYGFEFCTNYIYKEHALIPKPNYLFFNISGIDQDIDRFEKLIELAKKFKSKNWSYNFIAVDPKAKFESNDFVSIKHQIIPVNEIKDQILESKILVEFQRQHQIGLSFRVFEALGYRKKLITTNVDIVNYDFYNPQNIFVLDPNNMDIPKSFVESSYIEIPDHILDPYRIDNWVKKVFEL